MDEAVLHQIKTLNLLIYGGNHRNITNQIRHEIDHFRKLKAKSGPPSPADFRILGRLAQGGFGNVYVAESRDNGQLVAIKEQQIKNHTVFNILNELRLQSNSDHPGVQKILGGFACGSTFYTLSTYMPFGGLREQWANMSKISCSRISWQLVDAVAYLGKMCIVHRDIKPGNILMSDSGNISLTDFGVAVQLDMGSDTYQDTYKGGTLPYVPPEVIAATDICIYSAKTDAYAVGLTIFEIFSGSNPYCQNANALDTTQEIKQLNVLYKHGFSTSYGPSISFKLLAEKYICKPYNKQQDYIEMLPIILRLTNQVATQRFSCMAALHGYEHLVNWQDSHDKTKLHAKNHMLMVAATLNPGPPPNCVVSSRLGVEGLLSSMVFNKNLSSQQAQELLGLQVKYFMEKLAQQNTSIEKLQQDNNRYLANMEILSKDLSKQKDLVCQNRKESEELKSENAKLRCSVQIHKDYFKISEGENKLLKEEVAKRRLELQKKEDELNNEREEIVNLQSSLSKERDRQRELQLKARNQISALTLEINSIKIGQSETARHMTMATQELKTVREEEQQHLADLHTKNSQLKKLETEMTDMKVNCKLLNDEKIKLQQELEECRKEHETRIQELTKRQTDTGQKYKADLMKNEKQIKVMSVFIRTREMVLQSVYRANHCLLQKNSDLHLQLLSEVITLPEESLQIDSVHDDGHGSSMQDELASFTPPEDSMDDNGDDEDNDDENGSNLPTTNAVPEPESSLNGTPSSTTSNTIESTSQSKNISKKKLNMATRDRNSVPDAVRTTTRSQILPSYHMEQRVEHHVVKAGSVKDNFQCSCGNKYGRKSSLNRHISSENRLVAYSCKYAGCSLNFKSTAARNDHVLIVHMKLLPYKCRKCSKRFKCRRDRLIHEDMKCRK